MSNKQQKLSIYLAKDQVSVKKALKKTKDKAIKVHRYEKIPEAQYLSINNAPTAPDWATYLELNNIKTSVASGLLFIHKRGKLFIVSFGYGYTLLDMGKLVDDFGLKTALNMLDKNKIKSSDIFAPSDHSKQRRTQTAIDSSLQGHDIDGHAHILKNITGKAKAEYENLSKSISATFQSIKVTSHVSVDTLPNLCNDLLEIYKKNDCERNFPEAYYIRPIKDTTTTDKLNEGLIKALIGNNDIYFDVPELVDFGDIEKYQIRKKGCKTTIAEFENIPDITDVITLIKPNNDPAILQEWEFLLIGQNEIEIKSFSLFQCLICEYKMNGESYYFSHGKWFCVDNNFIKQVNDKVEAAKKSDICGKSIPPFNHTGEADYNKFLTKELKATKLKAKLLDKKLINMEGHDKIEACDVFCSSGDSNTFIHVKIKHGGSSGLSHLFKQGDVSLTLLNSRDIKFNEELERLVPKFKNPKFKNIKSVVHFLIISKNNNKRLPLFANVALFKTIDQIRAKNADVYWSII